MKTKLSLSELFGLRTTGLGLVAARLLIILALSSALFALCPSPFALSQVPQGFNYQAIARDGSGNPITTDINVKIAILTSENDLDVIWEEEHPIVTPDAHGLFSIVVGQGNDLSGGLVSFSEIDWTVTPKYIRTKINDVKLGTAKLWSVPYAMVADSLGGTLSKLKVKGSSGSTLDEALFEVKNKAGQTVFAVYNEGVRIYIGDGSKSPKGGFSVGGFGSVKDENNKQYLFVDDDSVRIWVNDLGKSAKGGFSVGGFGYTKEKPKKYLYANEDSVRIYIDDTGKAAKGGFSVGGFDQGKGYTNFLNVSTDASGIVSPAVNRILWYPLKNAFLTGRVLITSPLYVGENSFATGYESRAKGGWSQAMGFKAIADGDYSTAIGKNAVANNMNSFAFGEDAKALNDEAYALGRGAVASGFRSFAFGSAGVDSIGDITGVAQAMGSYTFALGLGSKAQGTGAFAMGLGTMAIGDYSTALGYKTQSSNWYSTALGNKTTASGQSSTAMGDNTTASAWSSTTMGYLTTASGNWSTAMGYETTASGDGSTAMGYRTRTTPSGGWSTAMGSSTTASGANSIAMGNYTTASAWVSTAMGSNTNSSGNYSTAMGYGTTASGDASTAMGWETTASAWVSAAMGYQTIASGNSSIAMGYGTKANTYKMTAIGTFNFTTDDNPETWTPTDPLFVIGNGIGPFVQSNALTVLKNGRVGLQSVVAPTYALELPNSDDTGIGKARANAWDTYSDGRVKSDQVIINYGLAEVLQMKPRSYFQHNTESRNGNIEIKPEGSRDIGLVAQEVYEIIPEAVSKPLNEQSDLWSLSYNKLVPVLVKAIQEQQQQINELKRLVEQLTEK